MDAATQRDIADRIASLVHNRTTDLAPQTYRNPCTVYTSGERLARELEVVLLGDQLPAGLSCEARDPGDWFTFEACGRSILILRGSDGVLRAFANACRHRGMRLADGCGRSARRIVCPYHSWSYDLDGQLRSIPGDDGFSDVDQAAIRLQALPVGEMAGLVYVGLRPATPRIASLGGAERELAPLGLGSYARVERREHHFRMNWKLGIDSFMEAYHLHSLHKTTLKPIYLGNTAAFDAFGRNCRIVGVRRSFQEVIDDPARRADLLPHVTLLYQIFPNAVFIHQQDHVELYQSFPDLTDPSACTIRVTLYAPEEPATESAKAHWKANLDMIDEVTTTEDFFACERVQANLNIGEPPFVTYGRNEPALTHFHSALNAELSVSAEPP